MNHRTSWTANWNPETLSYRQEEQRLLARLNSDYGTWNEYHLRRRLLNALYGFSRYRERNLVEVQRWRGLPILESTMGYRKKLIQVEERIFRNEVLCKAIVSHATEFYGIEQKELDAHTKEAEKNNQVADKVSVSQALKQRPRLGREGIQEREDAFPCILGSLSTLYLDADSSKLVKVLLHGASLGRLGHEVASLGVTVPDIDMKPSSTLLVEGDFTVVFADQQNHYDVITTHFFIDKAQNLMSYFDTIHRLLKPGGKNVRGKEAEYGFNARALTKNVYKAQTWVARKKS
ncbi:hypothetical protein K469DRAFT_733031 [Zopfia rhizophila CBS 207.26]|uniref:Uncharacterized protein n=1 Tax=Zopfia rhizophila CBS 207.26 TaxID=1314779 RepID=A0A6A6DG66_9PEZI|nr:hypothetical protein K469DRAFT_733031 [Zopfia rhizophila CBS 207.26]